MSLAKITLYGMARWMQESEDDLFANMTLPTGWDKDLLVDTIMLHGAEFEVLYAEPQFMKNAIGIWSDKWYFTLERWIKVLNMDYNPIENYDRIEEWNDVGNRSRDNTQSTSTSNKEDNSSSSTAATNTSSKHGNEVEHKVSAYDSTSYQESNKDILKDDNTDENIMNAMNSTSKRDNNIATAATGNEKENHVDAHTGRIHGNIGTVSSQNMVNQELEVARFNMYEEAANLFLTELVIYTY